MAEEVQNLVPGEDQREDVVRQPRTLTCRGSPGMTILSVFVGLLLAGQAVSVYFITQQHSTIQALTATTTALKLKDMIKNLPGSPPSRNRPKLRIASFSMPLAYSDSDDSPQKLEKIAQESNKVEDAAKYWLLRTNPLRTYPSFNGSTALENLRELKKTLSDQEWMAFDAWLQQWYLFHLVQTTKTSDPTPETPEPTTAGAPVVSDCLEKARKVMPGKFVPQCDEKGQYMPKQCWRSTRYCWCVYSNGTEIPDTKSKAKIDCGDFQDPVTPQDMMDFQDLADQQDLMGAEFA